MSKKKDKNKKYHVQFTHNGEIDYTESYETYERAVEILNEEKWDDLQLFARELECNEAFITEDTETEHELTMRNGTTWGAKIIIDD